MQIPREDIEALRREKYGGALDANMHDDIARLMKGEPLAYVIGTQPFLGVDVSLTTHPLIPRSETEWWTELLIEHVKTLTDPSILDLCAGSGAIGLAVLKHVEGAHVSFAELSPEHLVDIRNSIEKNGLDSSRTTLSYGDVFAPYKDEKFSVIATNPPYIPEDRELPASVAHFEPHEALFSGTDGLALISRILQETPLYLKPGGELWLEFDAPQAKVVQNLALEHGAQDARIHTDLYGRPRLLVAYYS